MKNFIIFNLIWWGGQKSQVVIQKFRNLFQPSPPITRFMVCAQLWRNLSTEKSTRGVFLIKNYFILFENLNLNISCASDCEKYIWIISSFVLIYNLYKGGFASVVTVSFRRGRHKSLQAEEARRVVSCDFGHVQELTWVRYLRFWW